MTHESERRRRPDLGEVDAVIIGGGLIGSCIAGFLAEEGVGVVLIDDGRIGGTIANAGSLHVQMQSRFMRLYPQNVPGMELQLPLYPRAVAFWQTFQRKLDADFDLKMTGGLMVAENREQLDFLAQKAKCERELGLEVEILERPELDRIAPYLGRAVIGAEICYTEGKLSPLLCNAAIRSWLIAKGAQLIEGETVQRISQAGAGFLVTAASGSIRTGRVVIAAASGSKDLAAMLGIAIPANAEPLHMNITEPTGPLIGHLVQHADRMITLKQFGTGQIVIGGGWPAHLTGDRRDPTVELGSLIANASLAQHIVPSIAPLRIIRCWAGINTAVDGKGVLGPVSSIPGLFIAIPGDAGYTLGPLSAHLVSQTIMGRRPDIDLRPYSPERFSEHIRSRS